MKQSTTLQLLTTHPLSRILGVSFILLLLSFHVSHYLNSDEGILLEGAWNIMQGKRLYVDFYEFIGPLNFYVIVWIWKLFGVSYAAARTLGIISIAASAAGVGALARVYSKRWTLAAPALFLAASLYWPAINHNTFFILPAVWSLYFLIKHIQNTRWDYYFLAASCLATLSIFILLHKGLIMYLLCAGVAFYKILRNKKNYAHYGVSLLLPLVLAISISLSLWDIQTLYNNFILPIFRYAAYEKKPSPWPWALVVTATAGLILQFRQKLQTKHWVSIVLAGFLLLTALQYPETLHTTIVFFPFFALIPWFLDQTRAMSTHRRLLPYALIVIISIMAIVPSLRLLVTFPPLVSIQNSLPLQFIAEHCTGPTIYALPFMPGVYFETRKLNPTPYYSLIVDVSPPEYYETTVTKLQEAQPSCIVRNVQMVAPGIYSTDNPIESYIQGAYRPAFEYNGTIVYTLKK